jgi:cytoskeletal protein CcmA (bactofilin family)
MDELLRIDEDVFSTIIDDGVEIKGDITCTSGKAILISGKFVGNIVSNGTVVINASGLVCGSVSAKRIKLAGSIDHPDGAVDAEDAIIIAKTGSVSAASLTYGGLEMEFGALIAVSVAMRPRVGMLSPRASTTGEIRSTISAPAKLSSESASSPFAAIDDASFPLAFRTPAT